MSVILRIAIRNVKQHRGKTLIIGLLIALGVTILVLGSSLVQTAAEGVRRTFIENYTGDVVVTARCDKDISLFGVHANMMSVEVPTLPGYARIIDEISGAPEVDSHTSQITGYAMLSFEDRDPDFLMLFGIEPQSYRRMFDSIVVQAGEYLEMGEEGIMLSQQKIAQLDRDLGVRFEIGDPVVLTGFGPAGFKVRELPLRGIFSFLRPTQVLELTAFVDAQSLRALLGMTVGTRAEIDVEPEETNLLAVEEIEQLFSGDVVQTLPDRGETSEQRDWYGVLGDSGREWRAAADRVDVWHYILIRLTDSRYTASFVAGLNQWFEEQGLAARAIDWKKASAGFGLTADVLRIIFTVAILIVTIVSLGIMVNTLLISIVERSSEIGTMRALGAGRGFVRRMILAETLVLSIVFGCAGMILGVAAVLVLRSLNLQAGNMFQSVLFGGAVLRPRVSLVSLAEGLLVILALGYLAHLYPVSVALRIQPIEAIRKH